jgi:hypothetical protein
MKRYEQPIKMAPRDNAGQIGKAQAPHIERRGYWKIHRTMGIALRLAAERQGAVGARLFIWAVRILQLGLAGRRAILTQFVGIDPFTVAGSRR